MPIRPRRPRLPSYFQERPFANVCNEFARLDKVEISYRHLIQYESEEALARYIERMTESSALFKGCWRPNRNRTLESSSERVRLPHQFGFRDNDMVSGREDVTLKADNRYPDGVRDMTMHLSLNFQRFWQNNGAALSYPMRVRARRREVVTPDNIALADLFTLHPDNFALAVDTFNNATNLLAGDRWHNTADVAMLFSKQLFLLRDYIEAQFPLRGSLTHAQLQARTVPQRLISGDTIRILPDTLLARAGGVAPLFNWGDFYLPHIEVAYDFHCVDAMQAVQDLMMRVLGIGFYSSAGFHDMSFTRNGNAPCCNIPLTKNVTIALYAKAPDRLRMEVRFKGSIHTILRRQIDKESPIPEIIEQTIASATQRMKKLLKHLPSESIEPLDRTACMTDFIRHISHAFGRDVSHTQCFLNSLAIIGSYAHPISGDTSAYEYLVTQGILKPSRPGLRNTTIQYSIAPEYAWIVETLRVRHFEGVNKGYDEYSL